jgi:nucleoside-diphosphate-sugar epimerase
MKVFVTGATGYIGFNVACAFRRAGHRVWGLARSREKARALEKHEIRPILGNLRQPETFQAAAEECSVLIQAAMDYSGDAVALDKQTLETFLSASKKGPQAKTIIYTSGVWVYGSTRRMMDEASVLAPPNFVAWRPAHEQMVLNARGVKGLVIRPGCVYGKQGGLTGMWFNGAYKEGALKAVGDGNNHWAMVHVDDLAAGYLLLAESAQPGEIFNLCDPSRWDVRQMVGAVADAARYSGEIHFVPLSEGTKTMGGFAEGLALDQHVDGRKAMRQLGWQPRHIGFVDEVEIFFHSWKAYQMER